MCLNVPSALIQFLSFFNRVNHYVTSDIIFGLVGLVQQLTGQSVKFNVCNFLIIYVGVFLDVL